MLPFFITFGHQKLITAFMKTRTIIFILISGIATMAGCKSSKDPAKWSSRQVDDWFSGRTWLKGLNVTPDESINKRELAVYYFKNQARWDKAFDFLRNSDLANMEAKRYDIDGDNLYATISEYVTKNEEDTRFEVHRKYIDIQHVITGSEQMSITPLTGIREVLVPYDPAKDIEFVTVDKTSSYEATPDKFFIFFPSDVHRPSVKIGENKPVRKVVIKLRVE